MRPQSSVGFAEKNIYKLKNSDKATLYSLVEARATPAPTSKSSEERDFVVDSGASLRKLLRGTENSAENQDPTTMVTANEEVQTNEEAQVYVYDLDLFVTVPLLEDTPAVLSLG